MAVALRDIADTALEMSGLGTFATALQATALDKRLHGVGPLTVFAPSDLAFAMLPVGTVDALLKPENRARLEQILLYHMIAGHVTSDEMAQMPRVKSLQGKELNISVRNNKLMVNDAHIRQPNIESANGMLHVIDEVLMP